MKRNDTSTIILLLIGLIGVTGGCVWCASKALYVWAGVGVPVIIFISSHLLRTFRSAQKKTAFMFNALENNDFTFRFQEDLGNSSDMMLNASLNRIKDILSKAKTDAAEREKYYELVINCVDTAIIVIDQQGRIFQTNKEALRLMGLTTLTHINQLAVVDKGLVDALSNAQPGDRFQLSFSNERGMVSLAVSVSALRSRGTWLRIIAANDINNTLDEKEIESWSRLIRVLTHEIMNSITPITSLSDTLIALNEGGDEQISEGLEVIRSTSRSLISFVESYRRLTRIPTPQKHPFYLKGFLERIMKLVVGQDSHIHSQLTMSDPELLLYADEDLIGQVIINLLKNGYQAAMARWDELGGTVLGEGTAAKSGVTGTTMGEAVVGEAGAAVAETAWTTAGARTGTGPWISVSAYINETQEILIEISDNGGGIPPEIVANMFIPFFTTKSSGSGIGLSLSRQIMRLHNATLQLTCNTPTRTTFTLCF